METLWAKRCPHGRDVSLEAGATAQTPLASRTAEQSSSWCQEAVTHVLTLDLQQLVNQEDEDLCAWEVPQCTGRRLLELKFRSASPAYSLKL